MGNSVPGAFFVGRPANNADEQTQAAAAEPKPANTQISGENLRPQPTTAATEQPQPARELKDSESSGSSEEESWVSLSSSPGAYAHNMESWVSLSSSPGANAHNMENKCNRRSDNPRKLPFELIKRITNDFSAELGRGAFGQVFKGVLEGGEEVAVKMLRFMGNINDQQFQNEFEILTQLEHPNIVRLVGFCNEAKEEVSEYKGKPTVCQRIHRALCLEYMPNGSLGKLLRGENLDKNWPIRYRIIKGTCEGLEYLQEGLVFPIYHLDLKPDNILLNKEMVPKISDFGLSRLIGEENSKRTLTPLGTIGYLPPEFIHYQVISKKYDIYSLGVIITKIITGIPGYSDVADMGAEEFVEHVHEKWKKCLQEIPKYASLEVDCKQVKRCIEIARRCMENDRHKRPTINDIMSQLDEKGNFILDSQLPMDKGKGRKGGILDDGQGRAEQMLAVRRIRLMQPCSRYSLEWPDGEAPYTSATEPLSMEELGSSHKDPPSEVCHPIHPEHKLKLTTAAGAPFLCDGCKEPGYNCSGGGGQSLDLHTRCALADDPLFDLHTLVHPLFGYGKRFEFLFLHESPSPVDERICDACGEPTRGFVYHCSEQDVDIHPCCASLPDRFVQDGHAFDLHRRASRPCALCPENEGQRRWFWAYRCNLDGDGEEAAVDLHVACLKETARRSWEANYQDAGDGALNVDGMLENMFSSSIGFDKFGEVAGTLATFITALVFGNLMVKM